MEVYHVGHLWLVGVVTFVCTAILTWLVMGIRWEVDRDNLLHTTGEKIIEANTKRLKAEDRLREHKEKVRLVQESLEAINGPKVDFAISYTG